MYSGGSCMRWRGEGSDNRQRRLAPGELCEGAIKRDLEIVVISVFTAIYKYIWGYMYVCG